MRNTRIMVAIVVCCGIAFMGALSSGCTKKKEAMYEGRPESYWLKMMKEPDPLDRRDAIVAFGKMPPDPKRVVPVLTKALQDEDSVVRFETARALGKMGAEARSAVPMLEKLEKSDPKAYVRKEAAKAITRIERKK